MASKIILEDRGNGYEPVSKQDSATDQETGFWIEIKTGPDPTGPARCLHCQKFFVAGDLWRMYWDLEHVYAIGLHTSCIVEMEMARGVQSLGTDEYGQEEAA